MVKPWSNPPERHDLQAAAGILVELSQGKDPAKLLDAIMPGETTVLEKGTLNPPALVNVTDDYVLVAISGTQNYLQWICHFLGSNQQQLDLFQGSVNRYFAATAVSLLAALADYKPLLATRRLITIGHSFGAAVAQLVAVAWQQETAGQPLTICFGCPRVGDPAFAIAARSPAYRVQTYGDVVPATPPTTWAGTGTPWTGFAGIIASTYAHGGVVVSLANDGRTGTDDNTMGFVQACVVAADGKFAPHAIEEYQRLLQLVFEPPPDGVWREPATVEEILGWDAITYTPLTGEEGGGMSFIQGIMYFRSTERTWGWGESFASDTDITNMLIGKLPVLAASRAMVLSNSCEIFGFKASDFSEDRVRNKSQSVLLPVPIPGKGSGVSIKDLDNAQTNILVDSIDYEVKSAAGSTRVFPFRGVPDNWIQGSVRTGRGINQDKNFVAFFTQCKQLNMGFKIYQRSNPQKIITGIAQDPVTRLLVITSAGHGLVDRNLVTIRGLKANPMVNGRWRVQNLTANTFALVGSNKLYVEANGVGTWQKFQNTLDPIAETLFNSVSTRKVGKPFGLRRGKASAKLLHH